MAGPCCRLELGEGIPETEFGRGLDLMSFSTAEGIVASPFVLLELVVVVLVLPLINTAVDFFRVNVPAAEKPAPSPLLDP